MIIQCWPMRLAELPSRVSEEAVYFEREGWYFSPFWLVSFDLSVKYPLMKRRVLPCRLAVNAVTGDIAYPPQARAEELEALESELVRPRISWKDVDGGRYMQAVSGFVRGKARVWADINYNISSASLVYKAALMWRVKFKNGSECLIATDTLTGEYGVVLAEGS